MYVESACFGVYFYATLSLLTELALAVNLSDQWHGTAGQDNCWQPGGGM